VKIVRRFKITDRATVNIHSCRLGCSIVRTKPHGRKPRLAGDARDSEVVEHEDDGLDKMTTSKMEQISGCRIDDGSKGGVTNRVWKPSEAVVTGEINIEATCVAEIV
jgi:hypothetical protein